jgi:hypothetical protein
MAVRIRLLGTVCALAAGAMLTGVAATAPAMAATRPVTRHLANGETIIRYSDGTVLVTAPMRPRRHSDGYGQNPGDCGTAKLWTYTSNNTYQLSLIGDPGVTLGGGFAETSTDGIGSLPSFIGINASGRTWTSGRVGIDPGLFASVAATVGEDTTSIGACTIAVAAPWSGNG